MQKFKDSRELLGTEVIVFVCADNHPYEAFEAAFKECYRIEQTFSRFIEGNVLSVLNSSCGQWVEVSEEMMNLITRGEEFRQKSEGAFNLSVHSILEAWGYDKDYSFQQSGDGGIGKIEIDGNKLRISAPLDLGGLGKGYAVDRIAEILRNYAEDFFINAGGDIWAEGRDVDSFWKVFFEDPRDSKKAIGAVELSGLALTSSSANRRKWGDKHHLVDPVLTEPAGDMLAVYVQGGTTIEADAYSTALFVLGYEKAKRLIETLPVEALLIAADGKMWRSPGFKGELFMG